MEKFIDAHCLVGEDFWLSRNKPELAHQNMLDEYHRAASAADSFKACILPFPSSEDGSFARENGIVWRLHRQHPWTEPVFAFNYRSKENFEDICSRLDEDQATGLAIWPIVCDLDLIDLKDNLRFRYLVNNYGCWFTVHVGAGNEASIHRVEKLNRYCPEDAVRLAAAFPDTKFNLTHCLRLSEKALRQAEELDNIIIDISGISTHLRWFEYNQNVFPASDAGELGEMGSADVIRTLMERPGLQDKLVFGSQYPFGKWYGFGLEDELSLVREAGLSGELLDKLLYKNFEDFFS